jgi:hypothetical protein
MELMAMTSTCIPVNVKYVTALIHEVECDLRYMKRNARTPGQYTLVADGMDYKNFVFTDTNYASYMKANGKSMTMHNFLGLPRLLAL